MSAHSRKKARFTKPGVGARPGTLAIPHGSPAPRLRLMDYTMEKLEERDISDVADIAPCASSDSASWIDVQGLGDEGVLQQIADEFGLHPLALADIVHVPQRPKAESYDGYLFMVCIMPRAGEKGRNILEQVSIVLGPRFVLTFQEQYGDVFDPIRKRLRVGSSRLRSKPPGYLAYALMDAVVDGYFPLLESAGERVEVLEDRILAGAGQAVLPELHGLRRELLRLRRVLWSQRDALNGIMRRDDSPFGADVEVFIRDVLDHVVLLMDMTETYREMVVGLMDLHLSMLSNRMNEVMKVLTIMASVFIPLTFIAGVYGMNFEHMPELRYPWAYPAVWLVMGVSAAALLIYFRRRGWIGDEPEHQDRNG